MRGRSKLFLSFVVAVAVVFGGGIVGTLWNTGAFVDAGTYDFAMPLSRVVKNVDPGVVPTATVLPTATPNPVTLTANAASRFGAAPMGSDSGLANKAVEAGISFVRVQLNWYNVEDTRTSPPTYNFLLDAGLKAFGDAGLKPIVVIWGNPSWAAPNQCGPIDLEDLEAFGQFMTAIVQRYSQPPYNVNDWELYNEGDQKLSTTVFPGVSCFGNDPVAYTRMLQKGYDAIHTADPDAKVHLGGLAFDYGVPPINDFNLDFLDQVLQARVNDKNGVERPGGDYFDIASVHFYSWQQVNWLGNGGLEKYGWDLDTKVMRIREIMNNRGFDKRIALSEMGWTGSDCLDPNTPELQAQYVAKVLARGVARDLYAMIWFTLNDWTVEANVCQGNYSQDYVYGLLKGDRQPRPAYEAFKTANAQFGGATVVRRLTVLDLPGKTVGFTGLEGFGFTVGSSQRWVLWNNGSGATTFTLPAGVTAVKDKFGQDVVATSNTISLGSSPVYLHFN